MICTSCHILLLGLNQRVCNGRGLGQKGMHKWFEFGNCKRKRPLRVENDKMKLKEIESGVVDKTILTQSTGT